MNAALLVQAAARTLIDHVDELTALDQAIGDGDHGLNMKRGALALQARLADWQDRPLPEVLKAAGMVCVSTIGGSSGPVFGTLLVTLAKILPDAPTTADLARGLGEGLQALMRLGKAQVGQKTLLDVLEPVRAALAEGADAARVRQVAFDACAATADLHAIKGRSSFLGERALGHVDPGSRSTALVIAAICDHIRPTGDPP